MCKCNCSSEGLLDDTFLLPINLEEEALEVPVYNDFRLWHVLLMGFASFMAVVICICCCVRFRIPRTKQEIEADYLQWKITVICICCCVRFRIPRTKQEIEADYVRKKITRKFKRQLQLLQNTEMDEMDLKRALDRVRSEFKSDTVSLAHSEADSIGSGTGAANDDSVFRKSSTGKIGVSIEELIESQQRGFRSKIASFVGFLRPRKSNQQPEEEKSVKMRV